jgi:hypothetical protein
MRDDVATRILEEEVARLRFYPVCNDAWAKKQIKSRNRKKLFVVSLLCALCFKTNQQQHQLHKRLRIIHRATKNNLRSSFLYGQTWQLIRDSTLGMRLRRKRT